MSNKQSSLNSSSSSSDSYNKTIKMANNNSSETTPTSTAAITTISIATTTTTIKESTSIPSIQTPLRMVHFAETFEQQNSIDYFNDDFGGDIEEDIDDDSYPFYRTQSVNSNNNSKMESSLKQQHEREQTEQSNQQQQQQYSSMYLCPQDSFQQLLTRSSPSSPAGSNVSIVGSLISPSSFAGCGGHHHHHHHSHHHSHSHHNNNNQSTSGPGGTNPSGNWKLRNRYYSKRRGQERSIDRERQPSICSDSETDSVTGQNKIESILNFSGNTNKKWSLPLPMVIRSSESDSASSSWSARSADEATEDERSPVPSPSASTHSNDDYLVGGLSSFTTNTTTTTEHQEQSKTSTTTSLKTIQMETNKLAINNNKTTTTAKTTTNNKEQTTTTIEFNNNNDSNNKKLQQLNSLNINNTQASGSNNDNNTTTVSTTSHFSTRTKKDKGKTHRKKKMSRAAESHDFQRMKTTNYGRCIICDAYVYFWGFECSQCQLICHKKCLKKMAIMCPKRPLPPRSSILNVDLETLAQSDIQRLHEDQQIGQNYYHCGNVGDGEENISTAIKEDIQNNDFVPLLVKKCTNEIERRSITRPGIYRMTGVASRVEKLLKSFESGPHLIDLTDVSANDLTSVLKVFLRQLKQPLITNDVYKDFIDIGRIYRLDENLLQDGLILGGHSKLLEKLHLCLKKLSKYHLATLKHMIKHLNMVSLYQEQNNMSPAALGIIFAPTIFRPRDTINDLYTEVFEAAPQARVIELLIRFYKQVFEMDTDFIEEPIQLTNLIKQQQQQHPQSSTTIASTSTTSNNNQSIDLDTSCSSSGIDRGNSTSTTTTTTTNNNNNSSATTSAPSSANLTSTSISLSPPLTPPPIPLPLSSTSTSTSSQSSYSSKLINLDDNGNNNDDDNQTIINQQQQHHHQHYYNHLTNSQQPQQSQTNNYQQQQQPQHRRSPLLKEK